MKIDIRSILFWGLLTTLLAIFSGTAFGQMAAIAAVDEPEPAEAGGSVAAGARGRSASQRGAKAAGQGNRAVTSKAPNPAANSRPRSAPPPPPPTPFRGPVLGDKYTFLNYEVVSVEKPFYTRAAKASGAKGLVQVEVLVSTDGSVLSAKARTGNKELWPEAERAARASKFNRPTADGRPARALGFLVYRFGPPED
jgi:outer membrane biosynthesis protein TonB